MKKYLFLVILISLVSGLHAQDQKALLTGTIKDALSDQPVDFVTVYLKNTTIAAESDLKGKWRLEVPANQRLILVFTRIGYKETSIDVRAVASQC
ncbi:MAG: carboxypeptidase-like regulatory domain-containing protein [Saprospiraceae bacterium]